MVGVWNEGLHCYGEFIDQMNNYQLHRDSLDNGSNVSAAETLITRSRAQGVVLEMTLNERSNLPGKYLKL
jgi:hypothetical protein